MTSTLPARGAVTTPTATPRHFVMCRPTYFDVVYAINPWMDTELPVDRDLALRQWDELVRIYRALGHTVDIVDGVPGQPDMVFAANCGTAIAGKAMAANMFSPLRRGEQELFRRTLAGFGHLTIPALVNEGQGDFAWTGKLLLAGTGYRTDPAAHAEAGRSSGSRWSPSRLVDPRFYHLDTCLFVVADDQIAYYPAAFSDESHAELRRRYPDALIASESDALTFGLNSVSDGRHVVIAEDSVGLIAQLTDRGYVPIPVDLSELRKAGGGAKCCTLELHS